MQFNLLSFKPPTDTITVNLYSEKAENTHPLTLYNDEYPDLWEQNADNLKEHKYLYCSFADSTNGSHTPNRPTSPQSPPKTYPATIKH